MFLFPLNRGHSRRFPPPQQQQTRPRETKQRQRGRLRYRVGCHQAVDLRLVQSCVENPKLVQPPGQRCLIVSLPSNPIEGAAAAGKVHRAGCWSPTYRSLRGSIFVGGNSGVGAVNTIKGPGHIVPGIRGQCGGAFHSGIEIAGRIARPAGPDKGVNWNIADGEPKEK